jgi:tyrosyl-tRNA synthetase
VDVRRLCFVDAEELACDSNYWALVIKVAKKISLARIKRAMTVMGRGVRDAETDFSKLIYPAMQVSDIFYLNLNLCLGGTDQRRAHILAREIAPKLGFKKPVGIHTPLLMGLGGVGRMDVRNASQEDFINMKMSKSKPETCIFIHDSENDIRRKIMNAYCPPNQVAHNPIIEFNRYLLFSESGFELDIDRPKKYGSLVKVESFQALANAYLKGDIHPLDLKKSTATALNVKLAPVRSYFERHAEAKELYERVRKLTISR